MASKKKTTRKKAARRKSTAKKTPRKTARTTSSTVSATRRAKEDEETPQPFLDLQLTKPGTLRRLRAKPMTGQGLRRRIRDAGTKTKVDPQRLLRAINLIKADAPVPESRLPEEIRETHVGLKPPFRRFHGAKTSLAWFRWWSVFSRCADKFGYMSPTSVRASTKLPFNLATRGLLSQLGDLMGDTGRETAADSTIPAGYTYVGQFVDHDITLDVSSSLDSPINAKTINNMRTPSLDLDSLYGRGPALDPFLYDFPSSGAPTAIKLQLGASQRAGTGGPAGSAGNSGAMQEQTDFDVPRVHNPFDPSASSLTAIIGDPRNDENLIVSQLHHTMLRFHNEVVDLLLLAGFNGDIFVEAKRIVTHHYQWAVVHDFLERICGTAAVSDAIANVKMPIQGNFRMPVEFAVGAYRFGHSMIRDNYWINFNFTDASLGEVFEFIRKPRLPVLSNWAVDFNAFFETGVPVPVNNKARPIDSVLAPGLETLPGFTGLMAVLAKRNLLRGLAVGLPSGQGMAGYFGITPMTSAELTQGLPADEVSVLNASNGLLKKKTPLWYYVLREAAVIGGGNQMGPVGARIIAETFVRILKRDPNSYLNVDGGFSPILPSTIPNDFNFADLVIFAGVTQP